MQFNLTPHMPTNVHLTQPDGRLQSVYAFPKKRPSRAIKPFLEHGASYGPIFLYS